VTSELLAAESEALAKTLGLDEFDLLLVGDGSGNTVETPCGWHCSVFDRRAGTARQLFGSASAGTNNFAELSPYVHALWAYQTRRFGNAGAVPTNPVRVAVVSDSEVTVRCGNRQYERRANGALWAAIEWFERNNYQIRWVHVRRNTNPLSALSDQVAGLARAAISRLESPSP
jgi:ribonuclease HI